MLFDEYSLKLSHTHALKKHIYAILPREILRHATIIEQMTWRKSILARAPHRDKNRFWEEVLLSASTAAGARAITDWPFSCRYQT